MAAPRRTAGFILSSQDYATGVINTRIPGNTARNPSAQEFACGRYGLHDFTIHTVLSDLVETYGLIMENGVFKKMSSDHHSAACKY